LITTLTSFATALDVTLSELRLEAFLPEDQATARLCHDRALRAPREATQLLPSELLVPSSLDQPSVYSLAIYTSRGVPERG
jgi:hypothetical protein